MSILSRVSHLQRNQLDAFMIDCCGFDKEQVDEWHDKADLASDIVSNGHGVDCLEYNGLEG